MNINEITISDLSTRYQKKEISVKEVVSEYLDRISKYDQGENGLNSICEINPDVISIAEKLDGQNTMKSSALYGIPILLKDNIDTADQMKTTAGSLSLADSKAITDAEIVKKLRANGAIILGKTNMTEFANYMTTAMPAGYSSRGGQVKSPYKIGADPSGSSTGSAVAVTANLCTASIGTDTSNSILSPASRNSIVGFRPSIGAISQKGIIPICFTCDTSGPMTRTVTDSAIIFQELTGNIFEINPTDNLTGMTIGVNEWTLKSMNEEEAKKSETLLQNLKKAGAHLQYLNIEPIPTNSVKTIQRYEFKFSMNRYLSGLQKDYPIKTLKDIIEFNKKHEVQTLRYGQTLLIDAEENTRGDLSEEEYILMLKDRELKKHYMYEVLKDIDLCIMFHENLILQFTGLPVISMPHGLYNDGIPYGIIMTALTDSKLLQNAVKVDQVIGRRVVPPLIQ